MKIVGLMPVRNEAWCLGFTLRVALRWCDEVVVFLHACKDESEAIALNVMLDHGNRVFICGCDELSWSEMNHRQHLLVMARERKATHIALVDADEFLTANVIGRVRSDAQAMFPSQIIEYPGYNVREAASTIGPSMANYHLNGIWGGRWFPMVFRDQPAAHWAGDRFHHRAPMGVRLMAAKPVRQGDGGIIHLWGANQRRLVAKHALYKMTDPEWLAGKKTTAQIDEYYNYAIHPREPWLFRPTPAAWLEGYEDLKQYLDLGAEPWQVEEVKRLYRENGAEKYYGLDLFGVESW